MSWSCCCYVDLTVIISSSLAFTTKQTSLTALSVQCCQSDGVKICELLLCYIQCVHLSVQFAVFKRISESLAFHLSFLSSLSTCNTEVNQVRWILDHSAFMNIKLSHLIDNEILSEVAHRWELLVYRRHKKQCWWDMFSWHLVESISSSKAASLISYTVAIL